MRTHRQFIEEEVERDPEFAGALREAKAELDLALQLAEARESLGMSQQELATRLKISQPAVSRYERGGRIPTITTALRFAEALGVAIILNADFKVKVVASDSLSLNGIEESPEVGRKEPKSLSRL